MQLNGFDQTFTNFDYRKDVDSSELTLATGSAFSGFSFIPFNIAFFGARYQTSEPEPIEDEVEVDDSTDDDDNSGTTD